VTEQEWFASTDPKPMLEFWRGNATEQELRLFAAEHFRHEINHPQGCWALNRLRTTPAHS
jgi:hypothetical protein